MIEAIDLTKKYEDSVLALNRLNLKVKEGEIYCLLGANGAGKTTTINLFLNLIEPTSGVARINGIDVAKNPLEAKKYLAYIPENVRLYSNFTARQNLEFFTQIAGKSDIGKEDYAKAIEKVGLPKSVLKQKVKAFSKGMIQKVAIAIALLKNAKALLLDEPTSGLDPKAASDFVGLLHELQKEGRAILMSTHDIFRAKEIATKAGILVEGSLILEKTKEELEHENLEKLYLSYVGMKSKCSN